MTADRSLPAAARVVWPWVVVLAAAGFGLIAIADQAHQLSATYDEVTYLKVGARWWRTGEQTEITRMGSPLSFWKIQQTPTLWLIDHLGDPAWIDDPITHQARLLPWIRIGAAWIWLAGLGLVAGWARRWYGDRAMALAAALFALSPNLLAHGALATMELPVVVASAAMLACFVRFLGSRRRPWLWASAALGGLAFSCKFTTVLIPPIFAVIWAIDAARRREPARSGLAHAGTIARTVGLGMAEYLAVLALANLVLTDFALLSLSPRSGSHPLFDRHLGPGLSRWTALILERSFPQDWVGFATQMIYQRKGGPSYLFGERRSTGWWYYYPVTLAVKVPLALWLLVAVRARFRPGGGGRVWVLPLYVGLFLLAAIVGSKRNYGVRYLLPLAPPAIVWVSALGAAPGRWRWVPLAGVAGMALAVGSIHPYELSYFNVLAGGPEGGRRILSDSNLDWGQGATAVARLQAERAAFRDLTWYTFGDTDPAYYGVVGKRYLFDAHRPPADLPARLSATTPYLAVSASLQWGPWGPPDYFRALDGVRPLCYSADKTVAFYRTAELNQATPWSVSTGRDPE